MGAGSLRGALFGTVQPCPTLPLGANRQPKTENRQPTTGKRSAEGAAFTA